MTYRPVGQEGLCLLVIDLHPCTHEWLRTTKVRFFTIYLCEGMSDLCMIIRSRR